MSKAKKVDAPAQTVEPTIGQTSYAQRFGEACAKADTSIADAAGIVVRREGSALQTMVAALEGSGPITTARWEAEFRSTVRNALEATGSSKEVVKVSLSRHYRCALAFSNGIAIVEGESEKTYVQRTRDQLAALTDSEGKPVYQPQNSGGKAKPKAEPKAKLNDADAQAVAWLVEHAMPELRALYAKLCPVEVLDKAA